MAINKRCPSAIRYDGAMATRCFLDDGHADHHRGRGPADTATIVKWTLSNHNAFTTDRTDAWSWEIPNHRRR